MAQICRMILPVVAYGDPVLRKEAAEVTEGMEGLDQLIENMWETMYRAEGVGTCSAAGRPFHPAFCRGRFAFWRGG